MHDPTVLENTEKLQAKIAKKRSLRQKARAKKKEATTEAPGTPDKDTESAIVTKSKGNVGQSTSFRINDVIQQYAKVQKKEKRAVLCFLLDQLHNYCEECHSLIIVKNDQEAAGLRSSLSISTSFDFALMVVEKESDAYEEFQKQRSTAAIMTWDCFLSGISTSHADYMIVLDMPIDLDTCLERSKQMKSITYFAQTQEENDAIGRLEAQHGVKMRQLSCLSNLAWTERRNALKMKLANLGSKRTKN